MEKQDEIGGDTARGPGAECPDPRPAPWPEGTQVVYRGTRKRYHDPEGKEMTFGAGMSGMVIAVRMGRKGTGQIIDDDDGDLIYDRTRDGASKVRMDSWLELLVYADTANEWEVIAKASEQQ